jgi:hypothetical protein
MANWTRLPAAGTDWGRRRQTKYNARKLVILPPRKDTHITQSYTSNTNRKHNNCTKSFGGRAAGAKEVQDSRVPAQS